MKYAQVLTVGMLLAFSGPTFSAQDKPENVPAATSAVNTALVGPLVHHTTRYWIDFTRQQQLESEKGLQVIAQIAERLNADHHANVILVGRSADIGSHEYCLAYASKMVDTVKTELMKRGANENQIRMHTLGREKNALASCDARTCEKHGVEIRYSE